MQGVQGDHKAIQHLSLDDFQAAATVQAIDGESATTNNR
jgi:hypothetical protein